MLFKPELIALIVAGQKTQTWRMEQEGESPIGGAGKGSRKTIDGEAQPAHARRSTRNRAYGSAV